MYKIGVNTFGLRFVLWPDLEQGLKNAKAAGVEQLEVCIEFPSNPDARPDFPQDPKAEAMPFGIWNQEVVDQRIAYARELGFTIVGAHPMSFYKTPEELEALTRPMIDVAKRNGLTYYAISPMRGGEEIKEFLPTFERMAKAMAAEGVTLMLHNHEAEFKQDADGNNTLDLIQRDCPSMKLELDVGWTNFAGQDCAATMEKYKDILRIVHFKDVCEGACEENRATCFTAVGEGAVPMKAVIEKAKELGLSETCFVLDQDASNGDMLADVTTGVANVKKYL